MCSEVKEKRGCATYNTPLSTTSAPTSAPPFCIVRAKEQKTTQPQDTRACSSQGSTLPNCRIFPTWKGVTLLML